MKDPHESNEGATPVEGEAAHHDEEQLQKDAPNDKSRRKFMGKIGIGGAAAMALAAVPFEPLIEGKKGQAEASVGEYNSAARAAASFDYRKDVAQAEDINIGELPDNGDYDRFIQDYSGSWSKVLPHPYLGIVNYAAYGTFIHAVNTGNFQDWQNVIVGNPGGPGFTGTFNGPMGSYAFDLEGHDSHATNIPPAPSVTSAQTADEQVEHYWASMLRDTNFADYATSSVAAQAAADLNRLTYIRSGQNNEYPYPITPQNLFRGTFNPSNPNDGNLLGPYVSQFLVQPTMLGAQALSQMFQVFLPGQQFGSNPTEYLAIESGFPPNVSLQSDPTFRYIRRGRDLSSFTHVDALHQSYLVATLVLASINAPLNPGNPYIGSLTQHGFPTFDSLSSQAGPVDAIGTVPEMATRALKAAWFHKWVVNLRQRPEEYGALIQAAQTHQRPMPQAAEHLHPDIYSSSVLPIIYSQYGSYLMPLAFPEGAPAHPCYPTGHGTVGGACIQVIKFQFDCTQRIRPLLLAAGRDVYVPSEDGLSLEVYTGADRDELTINGELAKLAYNITFGHGIHSGIHFRSSSLYSILLGEQVGLSVLQDRANSYAEPFTISFTKFDGTTVTITNQW